MRKYLAMLATAAIVLVAVNAAVANPVTTTQSEPVCATDALGQARSIVHVSYQRKRWHHQHPLSDARRAELELHVSCIGPNDRRDLKSYRQKAKDRFFDYRRFRLVAPLRCGSGPYGYSPIPCYIVECESHGDYRAINTSSGAGGKYQIMPATWVAYGGGRSGPRWASPREQSEVAARIWADVGSSAWSCA